MQNNSDKFDHLIALAATKCIDEDVKELNDVDIADVKFDASYYRKRKQNINKCKRRANFRLRKVVAVRVAAAVMIMITLACFLIGCVPRWRQAIYEAIVKWYDDCFSVRYEDSNEQEAETRHEETTATESEKVIVAPNYIEEIRKPTHLPEGVWEDVVAQNTTTISIDYYFNEEYLFSFKQALLKSNDNYVDNEDATVMNIKIDGNDATVVEYVNKKEIYIFWNDGAYSYHISSTECDTDTLVEYAESVK